MNTHLKYFALIALTALAFASGCWPKPEEVYFRIPEVSYAYLPYNDNSAFDMRHSAGSTSHFTLASHRRETFPLEDCGRCSTREYGEYDAYEFIGDNPALKLNVSLSSDGYDGNPNPPYISFVAGANAQYSLELSIDPCAPSGNAHVCLDSLNLLGRTYYDVYKMPLSGNNTSGAFPDTLWYNASSGFLKVSMFNREFWELLP